MNDLRLPEEREPLTQPVETLPTNPVDGKFNMSELWQEFLLDLLMATVLGLVVYRYSYSSGWAIITWMLILLAGMLKQGLKHMIHRVKPAYKKAPAWIRLFLKSIPINLVALVVLVKLLGSTLGLFSAAVFIVGLTTVLWLNQTDVPRF